MSGQKSPFPRSPYGVLGLRPGADRAAVDEAYRRLMKLHHPDLPDGDAEQAAEINRAYASLKRGLDLPPSAFPAVEDRNRLKRGERTRRRGLIAGLVMIAAAIGAVMIVPEPSGPTSAARTAGPVATASRTPDPDTLDLRSLPDEQSVVSGVELARRFAGQRNGEEADRFSRSCDQDLAAFPSLNLLDHCIAFDAATGLLAGNPDRGRFRSEEMAVRHVRAAMRVSNDPVLAEDRIEAIRRATEQLLVAREPESVLRGS